MFPATPRAQVTLLWLSLAVLTLSCALADLPPGTRRANAYLPPDNKGYDYKPPGGGPPARPPPGPPSGPPARPPPGPPARPPAGPPGGGYPAPGPRPTPGFPGGGGPGAPGDDHVHMPGMPFDFNYAVKEEAYGNDYSHNAISDGDVTKGEYRVQLPDGRTQIVRYTADWKNGFMAQVSYEGTPRFGNGPAGPGGPQGPGGGGGGGNNGAFQGY